DGVDAVRAHDRIIAAAPSEQAAMYARMQSLEAPIHELGEAGVVRHFAYRQSSVAQQPRAAARGQQLDAAAVQFGAERRQSALVRDRQQRTSDGHELELFRQSELSQLLAQRAPIDAENHCGAALVARGVVELGAKQRLLDLAEH